MNIAKRQLYIFLLVLLTPIYFIIGFTWAVFARLHAKNTQGKPSLVWGATPIISNSYWSKAMRLAGYESETFTNGYFGTINSREDWDILIEEKYGNIIPNFLKYYLAFLESLTKYDVFFLSFNGFFLGLTPLWRLEALLLRLAGKKIVLMPYGADAYVYRNIRSTSIIHGLMMSYPKASRNQSEIAARVDCWCSKADVVIPGLMGPDGFGRWDVLLPSQLHIDTDKWKESSRMTWADGLSDTVYIAHAPNHRGCKGTEFIIQAVDALKEQGLNIELILLEKIQNSEVKKIFEHQVDILVDQIILTGHGLNGLEGMASGLPVICNLEDETYILPFRRWSYFSECPIVSACPENLVDVLRKLVTRPELRHQLGKAGREYVEKYHGLDSAQYLFSNVIDYVYGRKESLINLYHPLLGEYPKRKPRVEHPLVNNRIID
jgi:hypothetical protein